MVGLDFFCSDPNITKEEKKKENMSDTKRKPGRPAGARNKNPLKQREVALGPNSFEVRMPQQAVASGLGTYLQLESLLTAKIDSYWTDERVIEFFATDESTESMENKCHFYSSSKGRLVVDDGSLEQCGLFPGVHLSSDFLSKYLHNYTDVANYGFFVSQTAQTLRQRARVLTKNTKKKQSSSSLKKQTT